MLEATDLVKRYGETRALSGFTLRAEPGEVVGLVGHNGAGKSTFARLVAGLAAPDAGEVRIAGRTPKAARALLGFAPQEPALYPSVTVAETLRLFGGLAGLRRRALTEAIDRIAEALLLTAFLHRRVGVLSGGQQRRTQAATAMLHRPRLLLLDEPTAGVDPQTRAALLAAVRAAAGDGAAVVYTTHYLPELAELGATLAVAKGGRVIARGTAADLLGGLPGEILLSTDDGEIRVPAADPGAELAGVLATTSAHVRDVELRRPTLDDLYRAVAHE
ncbi:ABC transporter ATP-binding protein [Amycolatopsis sp. NPDC049252]|uniref:ABC transporter ATP-binding protein n=1 Tax=Amycolatopsis sp. NPDC049252 TaxID=3363933 RepID=UPI003711DA33